MIKQITDYLNQCKCEFKLMAPTGRAASILHKKTGVKATTIHRGIYNFKDIEIVVSKEDIAKSTYKIFFPILETDSPLVCIVDESSMVTNGISSNELYDFGSGHLLNDLLSFTFRHKKGKLIFLGDPAQLPPIGEIRSDALDENYFRNHGYIVESHVLTQVMRQDKDSGILANALQIRDAYNAEIYNQLQLTYTDDVLKLAPEQVVDTYLRYFPKPQLGNSVIISYSNASANLYNKDIRRIMFGDDIQYPHIGDIIMVVSNHYDSKNDNGKIPMDIMNGEFAQILKIGKIEKQSAPVKTGEERIIVELEFMQTSLLLENGTIWHGKIIVNPLLNDEHRNLSVTCLKALFINFCIRHPELESKKNHEAFIESYKRDEYVNALRVKYGYAITCHKAQGGEWGTVFVNAEGISVNHFGLRWLYTAFTRTRQTLYGVNIPSQSPISEWKIKDHIIQVTHCCTEYPCHVLALPALTSLPFHEDNVPDFLKAKYQLVVQQLTDSDYSVENVKSFPYRERYSIVSSDKRRIVIDFIYNGKGIFRPAKCEDNDLQQLLNDIKEQTEEYPTLNYEPTTNAAQFLFNVMTQACDECDVKIMGITEDLTHYRIVYCLQTSGKYSWLNVFLTNKGMVSYIEPYSDIQDDEKLQSLIVTLKKISKQQLFG